MLEGAAARTLAVLTLMGALFTAAAEESWILLEEGRARFEAREFDKALLAFKDAARLRRERYARTAESLDTVMGSREARENGDSLRFLLDTLSRRDLREMDLRRIREGAGDSLLAEIRAIERYRISDVFQNLIDVISDLLLLLPQERLGDSLSGLRERISECARFPEAEFWIGRVFLAEGEHKLAERQYLLAISQASSLLVPSDVHEFRYALAALYTDRRDYAGMETTLKQVLAADPLYVDPAKARLLEAMQAALSAQGIDKFLTLYRHDARFAARAYRTLGEFYVKTGRFGQGLKHLMLAVDIVAGRMIQARLEADPDYAFSSLGGLIADMAKDKALADYAAEESLDRTLFYLGAALYGEGRAAQARQVWKALSTREGEWARRAADYYTRPRVDPAQEYPEL